MSDIHALSGAYAIDALDDIERAQFERHLAECAECRAEVASLREAGGMLAEAVAAAPPPGLRDRVLADIATVRPLPPVNVPVTRRRRFRPAALVAAAAAVIAVGAGAVVWQPWADETSQSPPLSAVDRVLQAPDAEKYTQSLPGGAEATLVRSRELNQAVVVTKDMPPPPDGKVYELWLNHEGVGMVGAGLMEAGQDELVLTGDPATAIGAGITVEPAGGSDEPTLPPVTLFEFENA
jgi:anti-sigma-K factor RskA